MKLTIQIENITDSYALGAREYHTVVPIRESDLALPLETFMERYVRPAVAQTVHGWAGFVPETEKEP